MSIITKIDTWYESLINETNDNNTKTDGKVYY
jgi:hypothetical protein